MSKLSKMIGGLALAAALALAVPGAAQARWHGGGGWHGGGWHGGGWHGGWRGGGWHHGWRGGGWGGGWGWGAGALALGLGLGLATEPYWGAPVYYGYGPDCGWVNQRVWGYGGWYWRRVWRCW